MDVLTAQETAAILSVAPTTVRRYIASGRLAAVRVGRWVRIERSAIESSTEPVGDEQLTSRQSAAERPAPLHGEAPGSPDESPELADLAPITDTDPLWNLIGLIDDPDAPPEIAENKHRCLSDAYADLHLDQ